jgi:hypothetical protein
MRGPASTHQLQLLGQLMFQSHVSYSQCGLGSSGTDRLVALVEQVRATRTRRARSGLRGRDALWPLHLEPVGRTIEPVKVLFQSFELCSTRHVWLFVRTWRHSPRSQPTHFREP